MADEEKKILPGPLRLKVKSDGTFNGTVVTDQDGRRLPFNSLDLHVDVHSRSATVKLEIPNVEVDYQTRKA